MSAASSTGNASGRTQALSVRLPVRRSSTALPKSIHCLPFNETAEPTTPAESVGPFAVVPLRRFSDASLVVLRSRRSNGRCASIVPSDFVPRRFVLVHGGASSQPLTLCSSASAVKLAPNATYTTAAAAAAAPP